MPKKSKFFLITVLVVSFALIISLADLFSSFLTIGNFAFLPSQGVKISSYKIYAISLARSSTSSGASENIKEVKTRSGAGYVYQANGIYYCLASAYENENDVINVQINLKESGTESQIIEIPVGQISVDMSLSGTERTALLEALNSFKANFKTLYDISISLDTGVKNLVECKLELSKQMDKIAKVQQDFESAFKTKLTGEIFKTKLKLMEQTSFVQGLVELNLNEKVLFSSALKELYIKVIILNKTLASEILN
jgi:hypothetical protein